MAIKFELTKEYLDKLKELISEGMENETLGMIEELHPADIAEIAYELELEEVKFMFLLLEGELASDVMAELEEEDQEKLLKSLPSDIIAKQFIDHMDSDDAADIIGDLPIEKQEEVLQYIGDVEQAGDIVDLMSYDEDTAGGLMAKEMITANENWDVNTCIKELRKQAEEIDDIFYIYVIDDAEILKGTLSLKKLLTSNSSARIKEIYDKDIISVKTDTDSEEVANIMDKYDLVALPVVDPIGRLAGRITIDDVVDIIREEAEKDYQIASGLSDDVESSDTVFKLTKARIPWLVIGLLGGIMGAEVLESHEIELQTYPNLAFFVPLIAAMAGNAGVQSSAIVVQSLATNATSFEGVGKKLLKELAVAFFNGAICSTLVFIYNYFFGDSYALTIAVASSLFSVMVYASVFGTFIPLALNRLKIDPAMATGPFITTLNDITGLFIYLTIGKTVFSIFGG